MRDFIVLAIIVGSVPVYIVSPYYGVLMWFWVTYFNPHRFTWSYAYNFPVALTVAVPTLVGVFFAKKSLRSLLTIESVLLIALWGWFVITFLHAQTIPLFSENMKDAAYEISHIAKILLMTFVMIVIINTRQRLQNVLLVSAGSLGLLALRGTLFGMRTSGESRVWGPPDSFLSDNNGFALALNVCLPLFFFLARNDKRRWMKIALYVCFVSGIVSVLLSYSRGGLVGLGVVLAAILFRSRHRFIGCVLLGSITLLVISFAPEAWMNRMSGFLHGDLNSSANQRLVAWDTAWNFAHDYPIMGGSFDVLPNPNVFRRYQKQPLPGGFASTGPHSIYFQLLADHGFVGLALFLAIVVSCFRTLYRLRCRARRIPVAAWFVDYATMTEIALLGFVSSGAFLGFVYLDLIYQIFGVVVILKVLFQQELEALAVRVKEENENSFSGVLQEETAAAYSTAYRLG
jgi:putative inorganic carbon (hco3(-)) transporter